MNEMNGAQAMVRMLKLHGVEVIFGLCGDTSLPFYDALYQDGAGLRHILTRDERHAAYMADAYARVTGRIGVCEGPSGGGATYILPGVVEANESSIPILAITSDIAIAGQGRYTLTELDQTSLMRPLCKWNEVINSAGSLPRSVRRAFREMSTGTPGAVHLGLPIDVQRASVDEAEAWGNTAFGRYPALPCAPDPVAVKQAVQKLRKAQSVVFICGGGVLISGAEQALELLAVHLDACVATTVSGQGSISELHPLSLGVIGSNGGTPQTRAVVDAADLIVFIGCRAGSVTTERWLHPQPGQVPILHLDSDPAVLGANYPTEVAVCGDARLSLEALLAESDDVPARNTQMAVRVAQARKEKFDIFQALAQSTERPIKPERVVATLQKLLPPEAIVVADPGTPCPYISAYYEWPLAGRHFISNRAHGALGYAMSACMGAQIGRPDARCIGIMGDGSFAMSAGELETLKRLGLPVTLIVINNSVFGWIKAGQKSNFEERYFSVDFSRTDHAAVARAYGLEAWQVNDPNQLQGVLADAIACAGPSLVDIICQPLQEANAPVSEWIA